MNKIVAPLSALILLAGCAVGPNYKKPVASVPATYRGLTLEEATKTPSASIGEQKWWDIFQDEQLRSLIRTALQQNYDLRIAASRVLQAQAQLGITRSDQFPSVGAGAGISDNRSAKSKFLPAFEESTGHVNLSAAWELDFWGKYRRATEAARANLLASESARQEVVVTLVADVSRAYFQLRALDLELEISKRTLASRQESLRLTSLLADRGSTSMLDVRQAEQLVYTAGAEIPALEQQIEQQENFISILLGKNPDVVPRGQKLTEQPHPPEVPAGLTSSLLERRPDIREAEQQLALLFYQQTIQGAFRSVSDALIAYRKTREFRSQEELLFQSAQDSARLSHLRYSGGVTGYLEVLTNETNAFSAELGVVQAQLNELLALVQLYEALGGGWQE